MLGGRFGALNMFLDTGSYFPRGIGTPGSDGMIIGSGTVISILSPNFSFVVQEYLL